MTTAAEKREDAAEARADAKADKAARKDESPEQTWDRESNERGLKRAEEADHERVRRAGMTPAEIAVDDAKKAGEAEKERQRVAKLTDAERFEELEKSEPIPPWQKRLPSGKVFDARAQTPIVLVATNGTSLDGGDLAAAREFYFEYVTRENDED